MARPAGVLLDAGVVGLEDAVVSSIELWGVISLLIVVYVLVWQLVSGS